MIHLLDGVNHARPQPQYLDSSFPSDALGGAPEVLNERPTMEASTLPRVCSFTSSVRQATEMAAEFAREAERAGLMDEAEKLWLMARHSRVQAIRLRAPAEAS